MKFFIFLIFSSSLFLDIVVASRGYDQSIWCVRGSDVKIQHPFWVKHHHSRNSDDHLGFGLICNNATTIMQFPSYGDLVVKSISYSKKKLSLLDPKDCVAEVFLNLNLSLTPFAYYYAVKNYTYLNCSASLSSFIHVPCLSGKGYYVYTVHSSLAVPSYCRKIRTVSVPFSYNPYIYDNSFGLGLTWGSRESESFSYTAHHIKVASFFVMVVAMLIRGMMIYHSKKPDERKQDIKKRQVEAEELLAKF